MEEKKRMNLEWLYTILYGVIAMSFAISQNIMGQGDNDVLWHSKLGEYIVKNGRIFDVDVFSWIAKENGWVENAHSWLGSVIIYLFTSLGNFEWGAALYCGVFAFVFYAAVKHMFFRKETTYFCLIVAVMCGLLCQNPRPQDISYSLFVIMMGILYKSYKKENYNGYIYLPVVSLIWANVHGGALPMMFAFVGLFVFLSLLPDITTERFALVRGAGGYTLGERKIVNFVKEFAHFKSSKYLSLFKKLLTGLMLSVLTGLVNPYGYKLYYYFCVTNDALSKKYISEWKPASFGDLYVLIPLVLMLVVLLGIKRKVEIVYFVPIFCCMVLGMQHLRVLVYGLIYSLPLFIWYIDVRKEEAEIEKQIKRERKLAEHPELNKPKKERKKDIFDYVPIPVVLFVIMISFSIYDTVNTGTPYSRRMTSEQIEYFTESHYERLYNPLDYGAKLIQGGFPCFIDSRGDLFDGEMFTKAIEFEASLDKEEDFKNKFMDEYNFDGVVLFASEYSTIGYMNSRSDFVEDYKDDEIVVYKKISEE